MKNDLLDVKRENQKFYGIYRAVVEENNPKIDGVYLKDGRIRVRVWGQHNIDKEQIPIKDLPLAQPAYPNILGSITGKGCWSVPIQGTHVFVFFENGDHMEPRYFACAPGIEPTEGDFDRNKADIEGFRDPDKVYPLKTLMDEPDMNRATRLSGKPAETAWGNLSGGEYSLCGDVGGIKFDPPGRSDSYPNGLTIESRTGQTLDFANDSVLLYNSSGSYLLMKGGSHWLCGHLDQVGGIRTDGMSVMGALTVTNGGYWHTGSGKLPVGNCLLPFVPLVLCEFVSLMVSAFDNHKHTGVETGSGTSGKPGENFETSSGVSTLSDLCTTTLVSN